MDEMVSIVIPAYNAESTLEKCLNSVINQTYQNFEVITVNDASSDATLEILKRFNEKDKRFKFIDAPHGGVSKARNLGVAMATGKYLEFMDADDTLDKEAVEKMVKLLEENDAQMVVCRFTHPFFHCYAENRVFDMTNEKDFIEFYQESFSNIVPWNRMFVRSYFMCGFDPEVRFAEDELCNLANIINLKKVVTTTDVLYNYYVAPKEENKSTINSIADQNNFWKNKTSFYFLGTGLNKKREEIFDSAINDKKIPVSDKDELVNMRPVDYTFWTIPAYLLKGVSKKDLAEEFKNEFNDENFIRFFKSQEKYGFKFEIDKKDLFDKKIERFTKLCFKIFEETYSIENFKTVHSMVMAFIKLFIKQTGELNLVCTYAKLIDQLNKNSTFEAKYINELLEKE